MSRLPACTFNNNHQISNNNKAATFKDVRRIENIQQYYHIHDKKLGEGGFAKVRLATHLSTRELVAIKCLDKVKLGAELPRIYNEILCLKKLKHRNIARLLQVFETDTFIYLVLEYCAGGELFDYIVSKSRLEEGESAQIIHDLLRVLDFIHENGFAHRDLKPENVLFDDKHQIKLIDFGLAANCSAANMAANKNQPPLDQLSTCCGSVTYAAPEVISGDVYAGPAVDVWSAGIMMYALLVGQLPFNDHNVSKLYHKIQAGIKTLPPFLSAEACDLIHKMLNVNPKARISVRDVLAHPWLKNRVNTVAKIINRRLDFNAGLLDSHLFERCREKFPHVESEKLKDYILQDFNYYAATYWLLQTRCPPRTFAIKRTPDRQQAVQPSIPYVSPTKRSRFVTVSTSPRTPKTPLTYLNPPSTAQNCLPETPKKALPITPQAFGSTSNKEQQENSNNKMAPFIYEQTPKKSIVKRLLESATPSKLRQPRKVLRQQNENIMNITLTNYKDPDTCLNHFQEALALKGFKCKRKDFSLKCSNDKIRLILEVCTYNNQCAIQRKRIKGDAWQYKVVCEEILRISNTNLVSN